MPSFGRGSRRELDTAHPLLVSCAEAIIEVYDLQVRQGWRSKEDQNRQYAEGDSTIQWPDGKHNYMSRLSDVEEGFATDVGHPLSLALDVVPWFRDRPHVRWNREREFILLGGLFIGAGSVICVHRGYAIRWGGNWDMDDIVIDDQGFKDLGHVELVKLHG